MSERLSDEQVGDLLGDGVWQVRALAREVQERRAAERPIPTSERLPTIHDRVLIWDGEEWLGGRYRGPNAHWSWDFDTWGMSFYEVRFWLPLPPAPPETAQKPKAQTSACEVLPERGWREVWHDPPPVDGRRQCRGPMKALKAAPGLAIEDGSVLPLWECMECHALIYAGLNAQRGIVSRRKTPASLETTP